MSNENWNCYRRDSTNLIKQWQEDHSNSEVVHSNSDLMAVDTGNTDYLLGLFGKSHLAFDEDRTTEDPSLNDMTQVALKVTE